MSEYIPLARKYRPKKFSDVIGQDVTTKILSQAILKNRLGAAILLTGTRGIGKTTIARIIAKVIRCESDGVDACGKCSSCKEFDASNNMDVIEMDAASHTGVDDIRDIIDSCKYLPTTGKYKVYIIDEVHMLSKSAFNALLKTLEEPPEHVKFIFATTELYKIPETILSRCLRFDLKRVDINLLTQFLSSICAQEQAKFEPAAVALISKAAKGSVRDALTILEQAINLADDKITEQQVRELLYGVSYSDTFALLTLIINQDAKGAVLRARDILRQEASARNIIESLMEIVHKITCIKIGANYQGNCLLSHDEELDLAVKFKELPLSTISNLWHILMKGNKELHDAETHQIVLEMLLMRLCYSVSLPDLSDVISGTESTSLQNPMVGTITKNENTVSLRKSALDMFNGAVISNQ